MINLVDKRFVFLIVSTLIIIPGIIAAVVEKLRLSEGV